MIQYRKAGLGACVALLLLQSTIAAADVEVSVHPSLVLVLKLLSRTHVEPTTGVVISADGLVIIPAGFVTDGDEIIVLDGGTDVVRNGRPASLVSRSVSSGLSVLSVEGLHRPAAVLSLSAMMGENALHLAAFPPAEEMAEGEEPLWLPLKLEQPDSSRPPVVSAQTPLPFVTGAIIDQCGYLAGLNLAGGRQSMRTDKHPKTILGYELKLILNDMQITLPVANCKGGDETQTADMAEELPTGLDTPVEVGEPIEIPKESDPATEKGSLAEVGDQGEEPKDEVSSEVKTDPGTKDIHLKSTPADSPAGSPPQSQAARNWILALTAAGLIGLVLLARRMLRARAANQTKSDIKPKAESDEPTTAPLKEVKGLVLNAPSDEQDQEHEIPDLDTLPAPFDGIIVIAGKLGDGTRFRRYCRVETTQINIVIGRGDADITIEAPAISRRHVRVETQGDGLTMSDLGSSNGTYIKGIPCMAQEIMFVDGVDEISLGDVRFRLSLKKKPGKTS